MSAPNESHLEPGSISDDKTTFPTTPSPRSTCVGSSKEDEQSHNDGNVDEHVAERLEHNVGELARRISRASATFGNELQAFQPEPGSCLDPQAPNFDARAWVKAYIKLNDSDPKAAPLRSLGVAYRDLNVSGQSTGVEYQNTTGTTPLNVLKKLARAVVRNNKGKEVKILRDFEGVVEEGEMLLVLGPPGSGCSTLLKTLAGETAGLKSSPDSYINFRGE